MRVLVIGSGGREHALCWKLAQSRRVTKLFCAPGNPGIEAVAERVALDPLNTAATLEWAKAQKIDLTVVGPELPLERGIVDVFRGAGLRIFGPTASAARLETSKSFAKEVMRAAGVPTARSVTVSSESELRHHCAAFGFHVVLKADGLAAGKGVFVCMNVTDLEAAIRGLFMELRADRVVIEEFLEGVEASFIVATDGERIIPLVAAHDHKRLLDGQRGPNTGGMGTVSPTNHLSKEQEALVLQRVIAPVLAQMRKCNDPFVGFLFAGMMITPSGDLRVLEFNCRLGDPETQVIMSRLESDLCEVLFELSVPGSSRVDELRWRNDAAVCVVLAASGYPESPRKGDVIHGIEFASSLPGVQVFHAGTNRDTEGRLVTSGGRVLNVTARGADVESARRLAYRAVDMIQFAGVQVRRDIGSA